MTKKQKEALGTIQYFIPSNWDNYTVSSPNFLRISRAIQKDEGKDPIDAFFLKTERGIDVEACSNVSYLESLLYGLRWKTAHVQMWKDGFSEGTLFLSDFIEKNIPIGVIDMAVECYKAVRK